jgi:hypothetical protein
MYFLVLFLKLDIMPFLYEAITEAVIFPESISHFPSDGRKVAFASHLQKN